jgi:hypothetical protein
VIAPAATATPSRRRRASAIRSARAPARLKSATDSVAGRATPPCVIARKSRPSARRSLASTRTRTPTCTR